MATKEEVADYINSNYGSAWTDAEQTKIRDNASNN